MENTASLQHQFSNPFVPPDSSASSRKDLTPVLERLRSAQSAQLWQLSLMLDLPERVCAQKHHLLRPVDAATTTYQHDLGTETESEYLQPLRALISKIDELDPTLLTAQQQGDLCTLRTSYAAFVHQVQPAPNERLPQVPSSPHIEHRVWPGLQPPIAPPPGVADEEVPQPDSPYFIPPAFEPPPFVPPASPRNNNNNNNEPASRPVDRPPLPSAPSERRLPRYPVSEAISNASPQKPRKQPDTTGAFVVLPTSGLSLLKIPKGTKHLVVGSGVIGGPGDVQILSGKLGKWGYKCITVDCTGMDGQTFAALFKAVGSRAGKLNVMNLPSVPLKLLQEAFVQETIQAKQLHFYQCPGIHDQVLPSLITLPKLTSLAIYGPSPVSGRGFNYSLTKCIKLKTLALIDCDDVDTRAIYWLWKNFNIQIEDIALNSAKYSLSFSPGRPQRIPWLETQAKAGQPWALFCRGLCFWDGFTVPESKNEALKLLVAASQKGSIREHLAIVRHEIFDKTNAPQFDLALDSLKRNAEQGDATAQTALAECFYEGIGVEHNHHTAFSWYAKAAAGGCSRGLLGLGKYYAVERGEAKDPKRALEYFVASADHGLSVAQCWLGFYYETGTGVQRDAVEAVRLYKLAADQECLMAYFNLGQCYDQAEGVEQDTQEAVRLYKIAAEKGHGLSQAQLGNHYLYGAGVRRNPAEGVKWCIESAKKGCTSAQTYLGIYYVREEPTIEKRREGLSLLEEAAKKGDAAAQYYLGTLCEEGNVAKKSRSNALKYYKKAATNGHEDAKSALKRLKK